jgi:RNA polymerase sigma factor (sigma-70 family)
MPATAAGETADAPTELFVAHRPALFGIVYNLLGSVADTEDILQETWLSWSGRQRRSGHADIGNTRAYLVKIAVNHAFARQASITRRKENYVGPWLPEPLITDDGDADGAYTPLRAESVSMALLVVLETLSPLERAVFVLYDVFGYPYPEIAEILERSPAAIRQVAHRAREHVHARRPRFRADPLILRQVTERFLAAALGGDLATLLEMMSPGITMWTDGGGKVRAASLRPVSERAKVARLLVGYARRPPLDLSVKYWRVNGDPAAVVFSGDSLQAVLVLDLSPDDGLVRTVYAVANPDKLGWSGSGT